MWHKQSWRAKGASWGPERGFWRRGGNGRKEYINQHMYLHRVLEEVLAKIKEQLLLIGVNDGQTRCNLPAWTGCSSL